MYDLNLEEAALGLITDEDVYLVFSPRPFELTNPHFFERMATDVYSRAKLVAYFMGRELAPDRLINDIVSLQRTPVAQAWTARIFVFRSNLVDALPHIALLRSREGEWSGHIFGLSDDGDRAELGDEYVHRLVAVLRSAGFSLWPSADVASFFPVEGTVLSYQGLEFEKCFAI